MTQYVVYQVEFGGDVDGTGLERWRGGELARFDTEADAEDFVGRYNDYCEIEEENNP